MKFELQSVNSNHNHLLRFDGIETTLSKVHRKLDKALQTGSQKGLNMFYQNSFLLLIQWPNL